MMKRCDCDITDPAAEVWEHPSVAPNSTRCARCRACRWPDSECWRPRGIRAARAVADRRRSEEHTSELQSLMRISYAVFCLKKNRNTHIKGPVRTSMQLI